MLLTASICSAPRQHRPDFFGLSLCLSNIRKTNVSLMDFVLIIELFNDSPVRIHLFGCVQLFLLIQTLGCPGWSGRFQAA